MEPAINPRIEIQNLEGLHLLVRLVHEFGNGEHLDITVKLPKDAQLTLDQLEPAIAARAHELLGLIGRPRSGT